jgi:segregation and condensation protein A
MDETSPTYQVHLPLFEGPLDLLLHLIKINELDIYDIPIAVITDQYLEYLDLMRELDLDLAGDYLVMAATLAYIKSKTLLPSPAEGEQGGGEEEDPREELVQRLLDYQRFKKAAEKLGDQEILGRDVFTRPETGDTGENEEVEEASLFDLMEALRGILAKLGPRDKILDFTREKISLKDRMVEILERLQGVEYLLFEDLFFSAQDRLEIILTFLAILELIRDQRVRALQFENFGTIRMYLREGN